MKKQMKQKQRLQSARQWLTKDEYVECVKKSIEAERIKRMKQKAQEELDSFPDSNDTFYYIAGYTSGGAPYGVTWEEMGLEPYTDPGE